MTDIKLPEFNKFTYYKGLKNNVNWQDKLAESLIKVDKPREKLKKFKKHPEHITSEESLLTNERSIAYIYKKETGMSESQSEENYLPHSLPILEIPPSPKKPVVKPKLTPKTLSTRTENSARFEQKFESVLSNILTSSEKIRLTMDVGITLPDGDEEWERRYLRAKEFYARFCRNYLYRLGRQVADLENHYLKCSGRTSNRVTENTRQHLLSIYNVIVSALQTYLSHMPTSLAYVAIDKLMSIYENVSKCCIIMNKFTRTERKNCYVDFRLQEVSNVSKDMVDKLAQLLYETPQLYNVTLTEAKTMRKGYKWESKPPRKKKNAKKTQLDARLSMYSISSSVRPKNQLRKTMEDLTKEKFKYSHVQSRYKTSVPKRHLPPEKPPIEPATKLKVHDKQSSGLLRNTPLLTPDKEDDIVTMVELEGKREKDEKMETVKQLDVLGPLIQGLCQRLCVQDGKSDAVVTEDKLQLVLKNILGLALDNTINTNETPPKNCDESPINDVVIESTRKETDNKGLVNYVDFIKNVRFELENGDEKKKRLRSCTSLTSEGATERKVAFRDDSNLSERRVPKKNKGQTVTGAKNAQLICIRHDDSSRETKEHKASAKLEANKQHTPIEIKISRMPKKGLRQLQLLPNGILYDVVKYKISFKKYSRQNPMYKKSQAVRQPWEIVDSIAETLLNEQLLCIAREIEEADVLQNIYQSEFY